MQVENRLIEIETQLAHLARHVEALDEVVIAQGRDEDKLAKILKRLEIRLARLEARLDESEEGDDLGAEASPWKDPEM